MSGTVQFKKTSTPSFRAPTPEDGSAIWDLVRSCPPLDENSMYANLIQCDHFRDTCVVAELDGEIIGWVSGHLVPTDPSTIFVWQVAVSEKARGLGLGGKMLSHLLERDICTDVEQMQTTITSDNKASWALFRKFGMRRDATVESEPYFTEDDHFDGHHSTENMVTIDFREREAKAA